MDAESAEQPVRLFECSGWEAAISGSHKHCCLWYRHGLYEEANQKQSLGDSEAATFLRLLGDVCSIALRTGPDSLRHPFGPLARGPESSTLVPSDLSKVELDSLQSFAHVVNDDDLRARISDILWVRQRGIQFAELAVRSYLSAALILIESADWAYAVKRLERALRLAGQIRNGKPEIFDFTIAEVEKHLAEYDGASDPAVAAATLMRILLELGVGDPIRYAAQARDLATQRESRRHWGEARVYWRLTADWCRLTGDEDGASTALRAAAATYESQARDAMNSPHSPNLLAAHHLIEAVEAYRQLGDREHADRLHADALKHQKEAMSEMASIQLGEMDFTPYAESARKSVAGREKLVAIKTLIGLVQPYTVDDYSQIVDEQIEAAPLLSIIGSTPVNRTGQLVASRGALLSSHPAEAAEAKEVEMHSQACFLRGGIVFGRIRPARVQIVAEHSISGSDILEVVKGSPFVPAHRAPIYATALAEGFIGNWLHFCHLSIPQLEESIRHIMRSSGLITSTLDSQQVQQEQSLNDLLKRPELVQLLGEDTVFELRGLLIEKHGSNLRNRMAHGLMDIEDFDDAAIEYLWWQTLKLCLRDSWTPRN
jgi:hypothetical protein